MKIVEVHPQQPTPEEVEELDFLKRKIEIAVADGKISAQEIEDIQVTVLSKSNGSVAQIYRKLELYRISVTQKLEIGELEEEWEMTSIV